MTRSRETGNVGYRAYKKNYLSNGDFSIWNRGTTFVNPNGTDFTADNWLFRNSSSVGGTTTITRSETTNLTHIRADHVGATSSTYIQQKIEGKSLALETVTISGQVSPTVACEINVLLQLFEGGVGGITEISDPVQTPLVDTWNDFAITMAVPNGTTTAKTVEDNLQTRIRYSAVGGGTMGTAVVRFRRLQLEVGSNATDFEHLTTEENKLNTGYPDNTNTITGAQPALNYARTGRKNYLINGNFSVWQRGISGLGPNDYTADRFHAFSNMVVSRSNSTIDGKKRYIMRMDNAATAALGYPVELEESSHSLFSTGQDVTLSFWILAPAGENITFSTVYRDSIASSTNQVVEQLNTVISVGTGAWQFIEHTWQISSQPAATNLAYVLLWTLPAGTCFLSDVQLEEGTTATDFEYVSPQQNLAECKRYYIEDARTRFAVTSVADGAPLNTNAIIAVDFPTTMRRIPDLVVSGFSFGSESLRNVYTSGFWLDLAPSGSGIPRIESFTADAEL